MEATRTCSVANDDCATSGQIRRGLCTLHYQRWKKYGDPLQAWPTVDYVARFEKYADRTSDPDGCHTWTGSRNAQGYGLFKIDRGTTLARAHRFAYETANGPIPDGMVVRHICDNPMCVRVEHLCLGTQQDNVNDRVERRGR